MNKASVLAFLDAEIERLQEARNLLSGHPGSTGNGSWRNGSKTTGVRKRRRMSAEARRRISLAQKKRWAARKAARQK